MNDVSELAGVEELVQQIALHALNKDQAHLAEVIDTMSVAQLRAGFFQFALDAFTEEDGPLTSADIANEAITQAAHTFGVSLEAVLGQGRAIGAIGDARAVAMTAMRNSGFTLREVGVHFDKDHTNVRYAVLKVENDPRLAAVASRIRDAIAAKDSEPVIPANTGRHLRVVRDEPTEPVETVVANKAAEATVQTPLQLAILATATTFHLDVQDLTGRDNGRVTSDARAVAMMAGRLTNMSLPAIASEFDRDHTSVLAQLRRVKQTPPLMDYAERIAATLPISESSSAEIVYEPGIEVVPGKVRPEHQFIDPAPSYGAGVRR